MLKKVSHLINLRFNNRFEDCLDYCARFEMHDYKKDDPQAFYRQKHDFNLKKKSIKSIPGWVFCSGLFLCFFFGGGWVFFTNPGVHKY